MDPARAPIFVLGNCRSGTTLLRVMLSAHPRIYITHEASFYNWLPLFPAKAPRRAYLEYYFHTPEFRWLRLDPERVLNGLPDPLPAERLHEAFAAIMREKAAQYGRVRYGDKTPLNSRWLDRIFVDFPQARVIHILRDPRTRVQSLCRMPWAPPNVFANAFTTELSLKPIWKRRDQLLQIRMEDLLADPRATMTRVLEYVDEPWDDAVLNHVHRHPDPNDMPPVPWLESSLKDRVKASDPSKGLSPVEIRMIEAVCNRSMAEGQYAPAVLEREPRAMAVIWECFRHVPSLFRYGFAYWKLARIARHAGKLDGPEFRAAFRQINPGSWKHYPGFEIPPAPPLARGKEAARDVDAA
jgi:hypothetical protein